MCVRTVEKLINDLGVRLLQSGTLSPGTDPWCRRTPSSCHCKCSTWSWSGARRSSPCPPPPSPPSKRWGTSPRTCRRCCPPSRYVNSRKWPRYREQQLNKQSNKFIESEKPIKTPTDCALSLHASRGGRDYVFFYLSNLFTLRSLVIIPICLIAKTAWQRRCNNNLEPQRWLVYAGCF